MTPQAPVQLAIKNRQRAVLACGQWFARRTLAGISQEFHARLPLRLPAACRSGGLFLIRFR